MDEDDDEYQPPPPEDVRMIFDSAIKDPTTQEIIGFDKTSGLTPEDMIAAQNLCVNIEKARCECDFIYSLFMEKETPQTTYWYSIMARTMLRQLRVPPPQFTQNSVAIDLCKILFKIDRVGSLEDLPKEVKLPSEEIHQAVFFSYSTAITAILSFVYNDQSPGMAGSTYEDRMARVEMAKKALFFVSLHENLSFLKALLDGNSGVPIADPLGLQEFVLAGLFLPVSRLINGHISSVWFFAAECFTTYMQSVDINPFAAEYLGYKNMPFYEKSWKHFVDKKQEDLDLASQRLRNKKRKKKEEESTMDPNNNKDTSTSFKSKKTSSSSFQETNDSATSCLRKRKFTSLSSSSTEENSQQLHSSNMGVEIEDIDEEDDDYLMGSKRYGEVRRK